MKATGHNVISQKIRLSTYISQIRQRKVSPYSVMLVNGTTMDRVSILNTVYGLGRANWDILAVRLTEDVTVINSQPEYTMHSLTIRSPQYVQQNRTILKKDDSKGARSLSNSPYIS